MEAETHGSHTATWSSVSTVNRHVAARLVGLLAAPALLYAFPQQVLGHQLTPQYEAPLPLVAYVAGAALAVAMSFLFVIVRKRPADASSRRNAPRVSAPRSVPAWLRHGLEAIGLIAWLWIVAQTFFAGSGDADVSSLFLWVYGWVGLALISGLVGPVWIWLNPFATIHRILSAAAARLGITGGQPAEYPERLGRWPAIVGFIVVVWLELVFRIVGGQPLGLFLIAYTFISVAAMAYFGRETWLANGETFSVWFELLGRLAPFAIADGDDSPEDEAADDDRVAQDVVRRPFASGLLAADWMLDDLVMISLATGAIIFDGLSQTQVYFDAFVTSTPFGTDPTIRDSISAAIFLGAIVAIVLGVARLLTVRALAAGLLPVAVGYLIAHYLTYLLVDGQRIILALNDPLIRGDNLLPGNLGFWQPSSFVPASIVWTIQLAAVVGGHIIGAWAGHSVLTRDESHAEVDLRSPLLRQLPLAVLMVCLTSLTLWSLGQAVIVTAPAAG
jgi:hypothetical protein